MCSFLLLFLLLIVGFDSIRNYNPNWNTEKAESTAASGGTSRLVLTPERSGDIERGAPQEDQTHAVCSPFQGQQVFAENLKEDHGDGVVAVAMWTLPTHQQKAGYKVCNMLCTLDEWYSSQYRTQATAAASGECQLERMGRMERVWQYGAWSLSRSGLLSHRLPDVVTSGRFWRSAMFRPSPRCQHRC